MARQNSKNQNDLLKAIFGLGALLLMAGAVFFWVGRSQKPTFHIPEEKSENVASKTRHSQMQENLGIDSGNSRSRDSMRESGDRGTPPPAPATGVQRAMQLVDNGQWQEAEQVLASELARDPQNVQALLELAMINIIDKHDPQSARPFLERALQVNPDNEAVVQELMGVYEQSQNWGQAYQFFNGLPTTGGQGDAYIDYGKGSALLSMGRPQEAAESLQRAIDSGYRDYSARESLATAYESSGRLDDAIGEYEQIVNAGTYRPEQVRIARIRMANTYINKGEYQSARGILEGMQSQDPKDRWVADRIQDLDRRERQQ